MPSELTPERPKPPFGYATWMDFLLRPSDFETPSVGHARAELAELRAQLEWQPIETAPKDGTPILMFIPLSEPTIRSGLFSEGDFVLTGDYYHLPEAPTHWMPMPAPPKGGLTK